jgi:lactoylglutathione lyase
MIPVQTLFEAHLTVVDLQCSMNFYGEKLRLELASVFQAPKVAFYWLGGRGQSMLGLWEVGGGPQRMSLHVALTVSLSDLLVASAILRSAGITPLDFARNPTEGPTVLAWMPAAAVYFHDPDGNLLEYLAMLQGEPQPDLGAVTWKQWAQRKSKAE